MHYDHVMCTRLDIKCCSVLYCVFCYFVSAVMRLGEAVKLGYFLPW